MDEVQIQIQNSLSLLFRMNEIQDLLDDVSELSYNGCISGDYEVGSALSLLQIQVIDEQILNVKNPTEFWVVFNGMNSERVPYNMAFATLLGYTIYHEELDVSGKVLGRRFFSSINLPLPLTLSLSFPSNSVCS